MQQVLAPAPAAVKWLRREPDAQGALARHAFPPAQRAQDPASSAPHATSCVRAPSGGILGSACLLVVFDVCTSGHSRCLNKRTSQRLIRTTEHTHCIVRLLAMTTQQPYVTMTKMVKQNSGHRHRQTNNQCNAPRLAIYIQLCTLMYGSPESSGVGVGVQHGGVEVGCVASSQQPQPPCCGSSCATAWRGTRCTMHKMPSADNNWGPSSSSCLEARAAMPGVCNGRKLPGLSSEGWLTFGPIGTLETRSTDRLTCGAQSTDEEPAGVACTRHTTSPLRSSSTSGCLKDRSLQASEADKDNPCQPLAAAVHDLLRGVRMAAAGGGWMRGVAGAARNGLFCAG